MLRDSASLALVIQGCSQAKQLRTGKQLHAHLLLSGTPVCTFLANHLLNMYSKCGEINCAVKLFETIPRRNLVSWTAMISGFSQNLRFTEALETFRRMRIAGVSPSQFAFSSVIQVCAALGLTEFGKLMHCEAKKFGFGSELFVGSNLADMYLKCGVVVDACKVFEEMPQKDEVSWTLMIDGYSKNGDFEAALSAYKTMMNEDIPIDEHLLCAALDSSGSSKIDNFGNCLHSSIVKLGFEQKLSVRNALIDMYSKTGDAQNALKIFWIDPDCRNIVSYTSLIDGYVETNQIDEALSLFLHLQRHGIQPNEFTFSSVIKACANEATLELGKQFHALSVKFVFDRDPFVASILIHMYGKCGTIDDSIQVFQGIDRPTDIAWTSMVGVFAQHGLGKEAIDVFDEMIADGAKPNPIMLSNLLTGCSHSGLVDQGLNYFYSMQKSYGMMPTEEHYSCVIDLLGRAGRLDEAEKFIKTMPFEPNASGWCSLLGACRTHGDAEKGKLAAEKLMSLEPENSGAHVQLSNIYAEEREWESVRRLRKTMKNRNMKKSPGFSWVEIRNETHFFGAEDWSHPRKKETYEKLDNVLRKMKEAGYVADTKCVPFDAEEVEKERWLHHHSERIAIAFALISQPSGKPIIVKKNLRVCRDCHNAIKYMAKVIERKIILRDNSRFHHFFSGLCSCGDFW